MPLIETLTLTLGPSIAKSILKLWLKDSNIALDITSGFVEVIAKITSDVAARQKAKRQFEEIGEKVALSLQPLLENEYQEINESSQTAVAIAVAETLDKTPITTELLIERNLDPKSIANLFNDSNPEVTKLFSEPEASLYHHMISEASQYIVDIASQLPAFNEQTVAEILVREDLILQVADQILEEVRRIREGTERLNPEVKAAKFEKDYRRAIIRKLDKLELFGVDVSSVSRRHNRLCNIFSVKWSSPF
ncbi:MAG: hypothetical protein FVQ83_01835 [Chloroflexi bacterium]|nr:hypothetical protein [Chloroflexota bacterium]